MLQVGLGVLSVDFLATVASYPKPDDKIRSTSLKVLLAYRLEQLILLLLLLIASVFRFRIRMV